MTRARRQQNIALILLGLAFAVRVWNLSGPSLWYDEAYLWWATTQTPLDKMLALSMGELVPPMHYFTLRLWLPLAGVSEFALRFPSVLYGVLAVAVLARLAWRLTGQRSAAPWALLLGTLTPTLIWASRETRMYGAFITWSLLAGLALLETLNATQRAARRRWAWLWGGALLGAMASLTLSAFWLIGQGLFALAVLARRPWSTVREWLKAILPPTLLAALLFLPWVLGALPSLGANATYWRGFLPVPEFLRIALAGMTVSTYLPPDWKAAAGGSVLLLTLPALVLTRRRPHAGLYPLCQLLPLGLIALVFQQLPKWGERHASPFAPLPALALALGWGMAMQLPRAARALSRVALSLCSAGVLTIFVLANLNLLTQPAYAPEDWRSAARYVAERRVPGDVVIVETGSVFPAWAYYGGFEGLLPLPPDDLLDVTHILDYATSAPALNAALQEATNVWWIAWLDHITDPTGIVTALLSELGPEKPTPAFHGLRLRHFVLERRPAFPPEPPLTARPEQPTLPHLTFWGYRLPESPHPAGASLDVWTFWVTDDPAAHGDRFYQVVLRLLDARGDEWARHNATPASGDYRPSRWTANTPVLGRYPLTPDPWTPPGTYTPTLTVYIAGEGAATVTLPTVTVQPAQLPPALPQDAVAVTPLVRSTEAPLQLLGVWIGRTTVLPCDQLEGWAYWETTAPYAPATRRDMLRLELGTEAQALPLAVERDALPWPSNTRFATQFRFPISCRALDMTIPLHLTLVTATGRTLGEWRGPEVQILAGREFQLPAERLLTRGDFGPGFATLEGYRLEPEPRAGQPFTVTLYWRAGVTDKLPYNVFVHVAPLDATGPLVAQHDGWPAFGGKPTHTWAPGEIITDPHPLPGLPAGTYHLRIGLYHEQRRLPVSGSDAAPDDAIILPLTVRP